MSNKTTYRALSEEENLDSNIAFVMEVVVYKDGRGEVRCKGREADCKIAVYAIKSALEMAQYISEVVANTLAEAIEEETDEDSKKEDNKLNETSAKFKLSPCVYS
jgi:hypothetical protein